MNSPGIRMTGPQFYKNAAWIIVAASAVLFAAAAITETKWHYLLIPLAPFLVYLSMRLPFVFPFGLYAFSIPFENLLILSGAKEGATLTKLLGIATILVLLLKGLFEEKAKSPDKVVLLWVLFALFCSLSVLWSVSPTVPVQRLITLSGLAGLYVVVSSYRVQQKDYEIVKWCILAGGVIAAILTVYSYQNEAAQFGAARVSLLSLSADNGVAGANKQAFDMLLPVSICLGMMLKKNRLLTKSLFFMFFALILFSIFLTGSRGGLFGCLCVIICFMLFGKKKLKLGIITAVTLVTMFSVMPQFFVERIYESADSHAEGRTDIWYVGLKALDKYWLFGAGLDGFPSAYSEFVNSALVYRGVDRAPHNIFVGNFVEFGIIGMSLMIAGLAKHYLALRHKSKKYDTDGVVLKAAFWGIIIASMALDCTWYKTFWLLLTMIMMQKYIADTDDAAGYGRAGTEPWSGKMPGSDFRRITR